MRGPPYHLYYLEHPVENDLWDQVSHPGTEASFAPHRRGQGSHDARVMLIIFVADMADTLENENKNP